MVFQENVIHHLWQFNTLINLKKNQRQRKIYQKVSSTYSQKKEIGSQLHLGSILGFTILFTNEIKKQTHWVWLIAQE